VGNYSVVISAYKKTYYGDYKLYVKGEIGKIIRLIGGNYMSNNKMKTTQNNKKEDGRFKKKNIHHDPQTESAKAVFDKPQAEELH
jgi:hypothetical protein